MMPPDGPRRPYHVPDDPFCYCELCRGVDAVIGITPTQREYRRLEWPRMGFTDCDLNGMIRAEELIDNAFDDDDDKHDDDRL